MSNNFDIGFVLRKKVFVVSRISSFVFRLLRRAMHAVFL